MGDKFFRLVYFLVDICPETLRKLFITKAMTDPGTTFTSLDSYLVSKRPQIAKVKQLRPDQYNLLFPRCGPANETEWDITLLSLLINKLFSCSSLITIAIDQIREVRNKLQHLPSSSIDDKDFEDYWNLLEIATLHLADLQGPDYKKSIKDKIDKACNMNMPDQGNTLCKWFGEKFTEMQRDVKEISSDTKDIKKAASQSADILQSTSITTIGVNGKAVKRLKIFHEALKRMHENFERTIDTQILDDFVTPPEVDKILTKLKENRLAVVSGHNKSFYLATALAAIKGMGYNEKRCVEMKSSSDWKHIDSESVDFALCCNPFGKEMYDEDKAKCMMEIFDSIQDAVKDERDGKKIAVLIASDIDVLNECKEKYSHELLDEVITVFNATSESRPTDLTAAECRANICSSTTTVIQNLSELTNLFLEHNQRQVDPEILKAAKDKIKKHKSVVLIGDPASGKTSVAVSLAASYKPSQVLLLTFPEQIQHVNHKRTHLVIIEDFAGKYGMNKGEICNWYKTLDLLNLMKAAGKLNLIVTCDKGKFKTCLEKIRSHPLLEHTVELHQQSVLIKGEHSTGNVEQASAGSQSNISGNSASYTDPKQFKFSDITESLQGQDDFKFRNSDLPSPVLLIGFEEEYDSASPISHESDLDFGDPEEIEPSSISNFIKRRRLERVKKGPKQRSRPDANLENEQPSKPNQL
ncbi:uncharacterized protein LOC132729566 [Ruditapes philippinarum]|uniref:uncharacterized protein LOC132729566 n=1 Tax=Ruditapes philippinarum TaxID=129788 RepID=UPI00295AC8BE|nr:uncharacterized protein LOC132729566 [Ruditapes philippinarum]